MLTLVFFICTAPDSTAVVKGGATPKGDSPLQKRLKPDHDEEQFLKAYPDGVPYDPVQVGKDYRVKWALVYVKKGLDGRTFSAPKEKVGLDIKGCGDGSGTGTGEHGSRSFGTHGPRPAVCPGQQGVQRRH